MARPTSAVDAAGLGRTRAAAFVLPALVLIGVFLVIPGIWTIYLGLTDYRLTGLAAANPSFVGVDNYASALTDPRFLSSLWLTVVYVGGSAVIGQAGLGFALAWLLRERRGWFKSAVEGVILLSWILPSTVVGFLWYALLDSDDGTVNAVFPGLDMLIEHPLLSIVVFNVWRGTAFSMMLYAAALQNVPPSHLETARLAGASTPQQLRDVVFPFIRRHVLTNLLLISLWTFNDFTPFVLTAGGPENRSEILPVYVYDIALKAGGGQLGLGAAISFLILLINLVFALAYLRLLRGQRGRT
ncbi:carbohydrate ABC transporter permease [Nonomuraea sediminis]|uniref:carbohydrate ABC transporter permease n=1 Tax=Nonomuraea sediminis TaxID=2835864 RepID=UPI001BDD4312|nr:sugar ABC transporter permease [Nonomuraea sediminis]